MAGDLGVEPTLTMEKNMVFFMYCCNDTMKCKQRCTRCGTTIIKDKKFQFIFYTQKVIEQVKDLQYYKWRRHALIQKKSVQKKKNAILF